MYCTLFQNQALCSVIVMHEKNQWIPKFFHARLFEFQLINIIKKDSTTKKAIITNMKYISFILLWKYLDQNMNNFIDFFHIV